MIRVVKSPAGTEITQKQKKFTMNIVQSYVKS